VSRTYFAFRAALNARDLSGAIEAAKALPGLLSLLDALELTLLAAKVDPERVFEECAARWLARVAVERGLTLSELMGAGAVLTAAGKGEWDGAYSALAALL
jgi:hypothetical protein